MRIKEADGASGRVGIVVDVTDEVETSLRLAKELDVDNLTRLLNRTAFKREAFDAIRREPQAVGGMLFLDLDNLKAINDSYGHGVGDRYLIWAGQLFNRFKELGGIVGRMSGDEFAVYLHGYASEEALEQAVRKLAGEVKEEQIVLTDGKAIPLRYSGGLACYPRNSRGVDDLLKYADFAMYRAKKGNKGDLIDFKYNDFSPK